MRLGCCLMKREIDNYIRDQLDYNVLWVRFNDTLDWARPLLRNKLERHLISQLREQLHDLLKEQINEYQN